MSVRGHAGAVPDDNRPLSLHGNLQRWRRSRVAVLVLTSVAGGIVLNAQYSSEQIATLLSFDIPAAALTARFCWWWASRSWCCCSAISIAAISARSGQLRNCWDTCCRDGSDRADSRPDAGGPVHQICRAGRPHRRIFHRAGPTDAGGRSADLGLCPAFGVIDLARMDVGNRGAALLGSLFYTRFWCRYLCPAGAFLSLLNHVRLLRRWVPSKWFGQCEFGLTASDHLDCLCCDRCRQAPRSQISDLRSQKRAGGPLLLAAVLVGLFVAGVSLSEFRRAMPQILQEPAAAARRPAPRCGCTADPGPDRAGPALESGGRALPAGGMIGLRVRHLDLFRIFLATGIIRPWKTLRSVRSSARWPT